MSGQGGHTMVSAGRGHARADGAGCARRVRPRGRRARLRCRARRGSASLRPAAARASRRGAGQRWSGGPRCALGRAPAWQRPQGWRPASVACGRDGGVLPVRRRAAGGVARKTSVLPRTRPCARGRAAGATRLLLAAAAARDPALRGRVASARCIVPARLQACVCMRAPWVWALARAHASASLCACPRVTMGALHRSLHTQCGRTVSSRPG
jgi:hypothetical protein